MTRQSSCPLSALRRWGAAVCLHAAGRSGPGASWHRWAELARWAGNSPAPSSQPPHNHLENENHTFCFLPSCRDSVRDGRDYPLSPHIPREACPGTGRLSSLRDPKSTRRSAELSPTALASGAPRPPAHVTAGEAAHRRQPLRGVHSSHSRGRGV